MAKRKLPASEALYPAPVVLVSCIDKRTKRANIITIAWCGVVCSVPPLLSISIRPSRYSHALIKETGDFVINIPTARMLNELDMCGTRSGRDMDKFEECSFAALPSTRISSPMIDECPVNIECELRNTLKLGTHDLFIGEVLAVHADKDILDHKGRIDYAKAAPLVYNQGEYWSLGKKIGFYGCSNK